MLTLLKHKTKMKKEDIVLAIFAAIFIISLVILVNNNLRLTGNATTATTISNVTISTYFAIDMSENLSDGIQFGEIATLPATNQNATHNHDGVNTTTPSPGTSIWMNVSTDSNSAVDFCIYADVLNTSAGDEILVGNETYYNDTVSNSSRPDVGSEVALTGSYVDAGFNVSAGSNHYYRFWLDVPAATTSGTYNNTVFFKGVTTGGAC